MTRGKKTVAGARIRRAEAFDAAALTTLARASKAFWGYDVAFMEACRAELTLEARDTVDHPTFVIDAAGRILGFYQLGLRGTGADIRMFFVAPAAVRSGIGRRLWASRAHGRGDRRDTSQGRQRSPTPRASIARWACGAAARRPRAASPGACCRTS